MRNAMTALAQDLVRVTEMRERYRTMADLPGVNVRPVLAMLDSAIEQGAAAVGSDDVLIVIKALKTLQGFTD